MDEMREALRDGLREGLREEAAPISRRLAEVKGLSNNALGRLRRLEATIESERNARVDDLALLVDLLTEGWRSMNQRLERIEALLEQPTVEQHRVEQHRVEQPALPGQAQAPTAGLYRLPTADAG